MKERLYIFDLSNFPYKGEVISFCGYMNDLAHLRRSVISFSDVLLLADVSLQSLITNKELIVSFYYTEECGGESKLREIFSKLNLMYKDYKDYQNVKVVISGDTNSSSIPFSFVSLSNGTNNYTIVNPIISFERSNCSWLFC